ncbi:MAG: methyltransferase [Acidobacteria bacterium]|nr:MAG: methyltransferase [Acidobacteriota bacterium]
MKTVTLARTLWRMSFAAGPQREEARYKLAAAIANRISPGAVLTEALKSWPDDERFWRWYRRAEPQGLRSADRKFLLRELLQLVDGYPGDTAECGVYQGTSSWLICDHFRGSGKTHFGFDSFAGLSQPGASDGQYWEGGNLSVGEEHARQVLAGMPAVLYRGWIPERFREVEERRFCFVHLDVDLYQPTLDSLQFFYPRTVPGGLIVCDDYGFKSCPGARRAFDGFMADKPERVVHVPTGQGFVVRRSAPAASGGMGD